MSAYNWTPCPRCLDEAARAAAAEHERVMGLYGTVPVEEFDRMRAELPKVDARAFQTFREDYEFYGAETGTVQVSYSGHCARCGLGLAFKDERKFWPESEVER